MSIPGTLIRQRDFSAGHVDDVAERRSDLKIFDAAMAKAVNGRPREAGGVTRRPGRRTVYFDGGQHDLVRPTSDAAFDITFAPGRFTARLQGGGIVANITGCPWTTEILPNLSWQAIGRRIYIVARGMQPQYVEYDPSAGAWALFAYDFQSDASGRLYAPYHRFADLGITLAPSALTGSITLVASDDVFVAGHVGVTFTYVGRQVRITAITNSKRATATVLEELPPTFRLTVDSTAGFAVGQTLEGVDTGTVGEITQINTGSGYLYVVVTNNFSGFTVDEYVIGANGRGKVTATTSASPGASIQWRECFMSALRGYPGSVAYIHQRIVFCDWPQFENAILASAVGFEQDFDTASASADAAIFTYVPLSCRAFQVIEGTDVFVLTDAGSWFMPVSEQLPFTQGNARFKKISAIAASNVRAVFAEDAVVFVGADSQRVLAIVPVGADQRPYQVTDLSEWHQDLFNTPLSIAVSDGSRAAPGRMLYVVNTNGTVVVGRYQQGAEFIGWFPWVSEGSVTAVCAKFGTVLFSVAYSSTEVVEEIDDEVYLDGCVELSDFTGEDAIQTSTGAPIQTSTGLNLVTADGALVPFAGVTMYGWGDGEFLGEIDVDAEGRVEFPEGYTDRLIGWLYEPDWEFFVPTFEGGEAFGQGRRRRKVRQVVLTVRDTVTFNADGHAYSHEFAGYRVGESQEEPRPERDEVFRYRQIGRSFDPRVRVRQPVPGPLTIIEVATEATI